MKQFIEILFIASLFTNGLQYACDYAPMLDESPDLFEAMRADQYKNLLWFVKWGLKRFTGDTWIRPLLGCTACMASIWGTITWFAFDGSAELWVPFCFCLCGLNAIINGMKINHV